MAEKMGSQWTWALDASVWDGPPLHTCPPLSFSKTPLAGGLDPAASHVDKASTWEKGPVVSNPDPATHHVQPWASHLPL